MRLSFQVEKPNHLPHDISSLLSFLYPVPEICPYIILSCLRQNTAVTIGTNRCMTLALLSRDHRQHQSGGLLRKPMEVLCCRRFPYK